MSRLELAIRGGTGEGELVESGLFLSGENGGGIGLVNEIGGRRFALYVG